MINPKIRLGVHTSIAGGLHLSLMRAKKLGCNTIQIFSHNPRQWFVNSIHDDEILQFKKLKTLYDIKPVFIHASYLINLCSLDDSIYQKSINLLNTELKIAVLLDADYVVLHLGSSSQNKENDALKRAVTALTKVSDMGEFNGRILIENTARRRGDISTLIKNLADILDNDTMVLIGGVCLDTCHAFAGGYDLTKEDGLSKLVDEIDTYLGRDKVKLIHLNDSKKDFNSRVDRHEHIGKGSIGKEAMKRFLRHPAFESVPIILETPKKSESDDPRNLKIVRSLLSKAK